MLSFQTLETLKQGKDGVKFMTRQFTDGRFSTKRSALQLVGAVGQVHKCSNGLDSFYGTLGDTHDLSAKPFKRALPGASCFAPSHKAQTGSATQCAQRPPSGNMREAGVSKVSCSFVPGYGLKKDEPICRLYRVLRQ